jgi:processive 1,2-diacylglycerol beta-glucosyltransferase
MVTLYDNDTGRALGTISDAQLQFLMDQLEEESSEDQDYYLTADTLEMLEKQGADAELIATLRTALGERADLEIRWARDH